jgi:hypothetical protein
MVHQLYYPRLSFTISPYNPERLSGNELTIKWIETKIAAELLRRLIFSVRSVNQGASR